MSSFGGQQFLGAARPFTEINPSGISAGQSLDTLTAVGEGNRNRAMQKAKIQQDYDELELREKELDARMYQEAVARNIALSQLQLQEIDRRLSDESNRIGTEEAMRLFEKRTQIEEKLAGAEFTSMVAGALGSLGSSLSGGPETSGSLAAEFHGALTSQITGRVAHLNHVIGDVRPLLEKLGTEFEAGAPQGNTINALSYTLAGAVTRRPEDQEAVARKLAQFFDHLDGNRSAERQVITANTGVLGQGPKAETPPYRSDAVGVSSGTQKGVGPFQHITAPPDAQTGGGSTTIVSDPVAELEEIMGMVDGGQLQLLLSAMAQGLMASPANATMAGLQAAAPEMQIPGRPQNPKIMDEIGKVGSQSRGLGVSLRLALSKAASRAGNGGYSATTAGAVFNPSTWNFDGDQTVNEMTKSMMRMLAGNQDVEGALRAMHSYVNMEEGAVPESVPQPLMDFWKKAGQDPVLGDVARSALKDVVSSGISRFDEVRGRFQGAGPDGLAVDSISGRDQEKATTQAMGLRSQLDRVESEGILSATAPRIGRLKDWAATARNDVYRMMYQDPQLQRTRDRVSGFVPPPVVGGGVPEVRGGSRGSSPQAVRRVNPAAPVDQMLGGSDVLGPAQKTGAGG